MPQEDQPGDVRVNRANLLRRIGRVCFQTGEQPGLPAPKCVDFINHQLWLYFDTFEEAAVWAERYRLKLEVDKPVRGKRTGQWFGDFDGDLVTVRGSSRVTVEAPADTDPDDLSEVIAKHYDTSAYDNEFVCACGNAFGDEPALTAHVAEGNAQPIEDAPQRGTDAAEQRAPKPATVEGHGHQRNGDWHDEPPAAAADLVFTSSSEHDGKLRRWWVDGPNGVVLFEVAEAGLVARTVYLHSRTRDLGLGYEDCAVCGRGSHDTLVGAIARQLHQAFVAEGESAIREQLERWYGEFLAGGEA